MKHLTFKLLYTIYLKVHNPFNFVRNLLTAYLIKIYKIRHSYYLSSRKKHDLLRHRFESTSFYNLITVLISLLHIS